MIKYKVIKNNIIGTLINIVIYLMLFATLLRCVVH